MGAVAKKMKNPIRFALMAALLLPITSGHSPALFAQELPPEAQQAAQKAAAAASYQTQFTLEAQEEDGNWFRLEGSLLFRAPSQRRLEIRPAGSSEEPQLVVSDGKVEWQTYPQGGVVYRMNNPPEVPGPHRPFSEALPETVRFVETRETPEGKVLRFEAKPLPASVDGAPIPIETIRIDVSEKDGLARELTLLDAKGTAVMTQKFLQMKLNVPISDQQFSYTPQKGVAIMDIPETKQ